jgi:hypothetical protein
MTLQTRNCGGSKGEKELFVRMFLEVFHRFPSTSAAHLKLQAILFWKKKFHQAFPSKDARDFELGDCPSCGFFQKLGSEIFKGAFLQNVNFDHIDGVFSSVRIINV